MLSPLLPNKQTSCTWHRQYENVNVLLLGISITQRGKHLAPGNINHTERQTSCSWEYQSEVVQTLFLFACISHISCIKMQTPFSWRYQSHENATLPGVVHGARGVCVVDKDAFEVADGSDSVIVDRSVW